MFRDYENMLPCAVAMVNGHPIVVCVCLQLTACMFTETGQCTMSTTQPPVPCSSSGTCGYHGEWLSNSAIPKVNIHVNVRTGAACRRVRATKSTHSDPELLKKNTRPLKRFMIMGYYIQALSSLHYYGMR